MRLVATNAARCIYSGTASPVEVAVLNAVQSVYATAGCSSTFGGRLAHAEQRRRCAVTVAAATTQPSNALGANNGDAVRPMLPRSAKIAGENKKPVISRQLAQSLEAMELEKQERRNKRSSNGSRANDPPGPPPEKQKNAVSQGTEPAKRKGPFRENQKKTNGQGSEPAKAKSKKSEALQWARGSAPDVDPDAPPHYCESRSHQKPLTSPLADIVRQTVPEGIPPPPPNVQSPVIATFALPSTPGLPSSSSCSPPPPPRRQWATLGEELSDLEDQLLPTAEQKNQKAWVENSLQPLLEKYTGGSLHMFGSCQNGFWMNGSDVDACLKLKRCTQRQSWLTKLRLVKDIVKMEHMGDAELVKFARVPIAKVQNRSQIELCDISVNNVAALENSRFVLAMALLDPRIPTLGRLIKYWAGRRRINNRSEGTLSTYTLILQLFYSLQKRAVPILPHVANLLTKEASASRDEFLANGIGAAAISHAAAQGDVRAANAFASEFEMNDATGELRPLPFLSAKQDIAERFPGFDENKESIADLLRSFFELWGREDFSGSNVSGKTVYVYDACEEDNELGVLVMRCPLTGKNVNPFTPTRWQAIHAEFERAARMLKEGQHFADLCQVAGVTPGSRGSRGRPHRE